MAVRDIIRAHMHDTMTYVYATGVQAKRIQTDLVGEAFPVKKNAGRPTTTVDDATLPSLKPKPSWLLVVLVDDDEDIRVVADWVTGKDASRVRFYFAPGTDLLEAISPWAAQGLPPVLTAHYRGLPAFRQDVGVEINNRIGLDFGGAKI